MKVYILGRQSHMQFGFTLFGVYATNELAEAAKAKEEASNPNKPEYDDYGLMAGDEFFVLEQELIQKS